MLKLISLNVFFAAVSLVFILIPVTSNWLWLGLVFVWCWSEGMVAQEPSIKWWHILAIFTLLGVVGFYLISTFKN